VKRGCVTFMKRILTILGIVSVVGVLAVGGNLASASVGQEPLEQVRVSVEKVIQLLTEPGLKAPGKRGERRERVLSVVRQRFDFKEMAKRSLAGQWQKRTEAEREQFVKLFSQILEKTYIGRVESYSDEKVLFNKQEVKDDRAVVNTVFVKNEKEIPIIYRLQQVKDQWLVYDVVIEGVSLVMNYRTQFNQILGKEDFPALVKRLEEKLVSMPDDGSASGL